MRIIKREQPGRVIQSREPREQMRDVLALLKKNYPDAKCALIFGSPLELLVATMLSAQCTDEVVNKVTPKLFAKYKTAKAYAEADLEELQQAVRSTGFYKNKGRNIQNACKVLIEKFKGRVPKTMKELILLPGVARKTANVVLFNAFGIIDGITVDTHVIRLSHRLGLSKEKTAEKIEQDLMKITQKKDWGMLSHYLIAHGRKICKAKKPNCAGCFLNKICPFIKSD